MIICFILCLQFLLLFVYFASKNKFYYKLKPTFKLPGIRKHIRIDQHFSEQEKKIIFDALITWENATKNFVKFHIIDVRANLLNGYEDSRMLIANDDHRHFEVETIDIIKTYSHDDIILKIDKYEKMPILGYACFLYYSNFTLIVVDRLTSSKMFKAIVMHEIGHLLGMLHNKRRYTLMYPYYNTNMETITRYDLHTFCKINNCNREYLI